MKTDALIHFPAPWLTCIALVLFFISFLFVVVPLFSKKTIEKCKEIELLPLEEGN